jgi:hypothetical protein
MMFRLLICFAWIATAFSVQAATVKLEFMTVGSVTYSNVTVFGANATDIFFSSDHGVSNVKLKLLNPELQKKFNYNAAASGKAELQQIADDKHYQENLAANIVAKLQAARQAKEAQIQAPYAEAGLADAVSDNSPIGKPAPDLDFVRWIGPAANITGKFAIISVWSPKSISCRRWIPALNDLHKTLAGKVEVLGVTTATAAEVDQSDPKIDFPCALDPDGKFLTAAGITVLPCVVLVDKNHVVRYQGHPAAVTTNTLQMLLKGDDE